MSPNLLGILLIILISKYHLVICYEHEFQLEENTLLKPDEIIYLLAKETQNIKSKKRKGSLRRHDKYTTKSSTVEYEDGVSDTNDVDLMKAHKVWSRWGKWGDCSVTCGAGAVSRRRVCVAGRCAPGEREEQRRPCVRLPCRDQPDAEPQDAD